MQEQYPENVARYLATEPQATLAHFESLLGSSHPYPEAHAFEELGLEYASHDKRDAERAVTYIGYAFELVAASRDLRSPKFMYQLARSLAQVYLNLEPKRPLEAVRILEHALETGSRWRSEDPYPEDDETYDRYYPERLWILQSLNYWRRQ